MKNLNLAIFGHGFVGAAVDYGFPDDRCNKTIIDPKYGTSISDLVDQSIDVTFICVPTPMRYDGCIDASILADCVYDALEYTDGLVVIKSTVLPDIVEDLTSEQSRVIYNPEFLTEKHAKLDFVNPPMHVFGGQKEQTLELEFIYDEYSSCEKCPVYHMSATEASFVKYGMNTFLSTKVLFFNQLFDLIGHQGADFETVRNAISTDPRIGGSHTQVPGHDGRKGFGGSCFVKDSVAMIRYAQSINLPFTVLEEVARKNQDYRNSYEDALPRELQMNVKFDYEF